ncbi:single-stranded DNA-binding protein [Streptomyces sp. NPDC000941]
MFLRRSPWRQAGENAAQSLSRGMRVIVTGRLKQRTSTTKKASAAPPSRSTPRRSPRP